MKKLEDIDVLQILENAEVIRDIPPGGRAGHEQARRRLALSVASKYIEELVYTFRPDLYDRYQELKAPTREKRIAEILARPDLPEKGGDYPS